MLLLEVKEGKLPPVDKRLPQQPLVVKSETLGKYGGTLNTLVGRSRDTRMLAVYGYARLVGYDRQLNIVPDIVESYEVKDGRVFTFKLRRGHRWSDGQPFTAEDFRYYWRTSPTTASSRPPGRRTI